MSASTTPNRDLGARAQLLAEAAVSGSLERKAAGCLVVLLASSKTLTGARKILPEIPLDDVRQAAADLLDRLTHEGEQ